MGPQAQRTHARLASTKPMAAPATRAATPTAAVAAVVAEKGVEYDVSSRVGAVAAVGAVSATSAGWDVALRESWAW